MYGGSDGNQVGVTPSGNVGTSTIYNNIKNVGRVILRSSYPYQLPDCPASWVTIYNDASNGNIWLGGITSHVPQVNVGYPILPGASLTLPVTNSNQISLIPSVDGDPVYIVIGATDNTIPITPGNPPPFDKIPPTIVSTNPTNGTSGIPINANINILASEALDPNSINNTNITINPFQTGMQIVQDSSNAANILILHSSNLFSLTQFTINIANIADLAGNVLVTPFSFNFTTSNTTVADTTPPSATSSNPVDGQTNVGASINPTITFSEAILPASVSTSSIVVTNVATGSTLAGYTVTQSTDQKTITIGSLPLSGSTQYRITIYNTPSSIAIKDLAGNLLDHTYTITFTTQAPSVQIYNVSGSSGTYSSMNSTNFYQVCSVYPNTTTSKLIGKTPVSCSFIMKKVGSPPGNVIIQMDKLVQNNGADTQQFIQGIGQIAASSLGTSDTTISFSFPTNTTQFAFRTCISVWYQHGDSSNYVMIKCTSTDAFDGSNTCLLRYLWDGTVGTVLTSDLAGTINVAS